MCTKMPFCVMVATQMTRKNEVPQSQITDRPRGYKTWFILRLKIKLGDPWDGIFYPTLTLMIDSYNIFGSNVYKNAFLRNGSYAND